MTSTPLIRSAETLDFRHRGRGQRRRDLRFQAEHIATTKLINSCHNCNATQVLVLSQDWPLADQPIAEVRAVIGNAEPRAHRRRWWSDQERNIAPRALDREVRDGHNLRGGITY
jgi:hypothetical protein